MLGSIASRELLHQNQQGEEVQVHSSGLLGGIFWGEKFCPESEKCYGTCDTSRNAKNAQEKIAGEGEFEEKKIIRKQKLLKIAGVAQKPCFLGEGEVGGPQTDRQANITEWRDKVQESSCGPAGKPTHCVWILFLDGGGDPT